MTIFTFDFLFVITLLSACCGFSATNDQGSSFNPRDSVKAPESEPPTFNYNNLYYYE